MPPGWEELDPQRALAESDAVLRVATAVQEGWLEDGDGALPDVDAAFATELRWWRWFETRLAEEGNAGVVAAIEEHAPAWLAESPERDAVAWWFDALAEIVAHAAARTVDAAARVEAAAVLGRPAVVPVEAELASWLVVLPVLSDAEHRALAPVFARLDRARLDAPGLRHLLRSRGLRRRRRRRPDAGDLVRRPER